VGIEKKLRIHVPNRAGNEQPISGYALDWAKGSGVWTFSCASSKRPTGEQKTAQGFSPGFSPGNDTHKEIALKGRPKGIDYNVYICCCM
jgi:hypothetical protein